MVFKGVVHGKTIELEQAPGLPDGQAVTVTVSPVQVEGKLPPGEGIRRSAGGWADDDPEGLDEYLKNLRQERRTAPDEATATSPTTAEAMAGLRRAAGGCSDDPEGLDRYLEDLRQQRKQDRRGIPE